MCTIGALRLAEDDVLLFKNKDFARASYHDQLEINADYFGPLGLETFADDPAVPDSFSGLSIGANRHGLLACVSHVKNTGDAGLNYDLLVEAALSEARDLTAAVAAVTAAVAQAPHWWGNLILADGSRLAALEVRDREVRIEEDARSVLRANHQPLFGDAASPDGVACSAPRLAAARAGIGQVHYLEDLFALLSGHDRGETGICNHGASYATVYSYVLRHNRDGLTLHVCQGPPCENGYRSLPVPLGSAWSAEAVARFRRDYPSDLAHVRSDLQAVANGHW